MDLKLSDHLCVVTGGANGIGRAIVEGFLREGCRVAVWDPAASAPSLDDLEKRYGERLVRLTVDVADETSVAKAVSATESHGAIDHLVHAAAIGSGKFGFPFTRLSPSDWTQVLKVNVLGTVHVAHAVAPQMVKRGRGTMVFIASVAGQIGSPTDPPYSASKAAVINFSQCVARDLAGSGIRVNTVCPGMVRTTLNQNVWRAWLAQQPEQAHKTYEEWAAEKIKAMVPLNRWQTPEDIADMVVFLSSDRACQVTGQTINVDGGFVMHW